MRNQLQWAAVSIMTNIAEGLDCDSNNEFAKFLGIARRSAAEVQSLLYASHDVGYLSAEELKSCYDQAAKTKGLIGGLTRVVEKGQKS